LFLCDSGHELIPEYLDGLSIVIAIEISLLNPDYVLLCGRRAANGGSSCSYIEECILCHTRKPFPVEGLKLCYSHKAQENGVIDAAIRAFREPKRA